MGDSLWNSAVQRLVALDLVACITHNTISTDTSRTKIDLDLKWAVMQDSRVSDLNDAGGMTDCGQGFEGDLNGLRVAVLQVEAIKELLTSILGRSENREFAFQVSPASVFSRLHFGSGHHAGIPASGFRFWGNAWCYLTGVKIKLCHLNLLWFTTVENPLVSIENVKAG
jgi:hypothetical protein